MLTVGGLHVINVWILLLMHPWFVGAYPGGAPDVSCASMFPLGHGVKAQPSYPPFKISVAKQAYVPGETIEVTLEATEGYFKGLFVQARSASCGRNQTLPIGVFTYGDRQLQTRHCFGAVHSALTHTSTVKKKLKKVYWTAPVIPAGHVVIRATFVKDVDLFWTEVYSDILTDLKAKSSPRCFKKRFWKTAAGRKDKERMRKYRINARIAKGTTVNCNIFEIALLSITTLLATRVFVLL